jgi:hypothetical protein
VIGHVHLVDVGQKATIADYVVRQVANVVDCNIISDVTGDYSAVRDANGHLEVVMFEGCLSDRPDPDKAEEISVSYTAGIESAGDKDIVPIGGVVIVLDQALDLVRPKVAPLPAVPAALKISNVVLVLTLRNKVCRYEIPADTVTSHN